MVLVQNPSTNIIIHLTTRTLCASAHIRQNILAVAWRQFRWGLDRSFLMKNFFLLALIAYPARYGASGIMSFIVNQDGTVYENIWARTRQR